MACRRAPGPSGPRGFAFEDEGGSEPIWSSLPPALAVLPEVSIVSTPEAAFLTACLAPSPGAEPEERLEQIAPTARFSP